MAPSLMPTYEYRCPKGHNFEVFHKMSESGPDECEVCGASPVERILFPVAVHYKGSGFYSTDYGKSSNKRDDGGEKANSEGGESSKDSDDKRSDSSTSESKTSDASAKDTSKDAKDKSSSSGGKNKAEK